MSKKRTTHHTAPPWRVVEDSALTVACQPLAGRPPVAIAYVEATDALQEALDNARLIAAAPDLLVAVNSALAYLMLKHSPFVEDCGGCRLAAQLRDVLARATGEKP